MKSMIFVVFALVCYLAASQSVSASPADKDAANYVDGLEALKAVEPELHARYRRATCDLLSGFGVNHSACAAHCLLRGNRGGSCNGRGVCVCRN